MNLIILRLGRKVTEGCEKFPRLQINNIYVTASICINHDIWTEQSTINIWSRIQYKPQKVFSQHEIKIDLAYSSNPSISNSVDYFQVYMYRFTVQFHSTVYRSTQLYRICFKYHNQALLSKKELILHNPINSWLIKSSPALRFVSQNIFYWLWMPFHVDFKASLKAFALNSRQLAASIWERLTNCCFYF